MRSVGGGDAELLGLGLSGGSVGVGLLRVGLFLELCGGGRLVDCDDEGLRVGDELDALGEDQVRRMDRRADFLALDVDDDLLGDRQCVGLDLDGVGVLGDQGAGSGVALDDDGDLDGDLLACLLYTSPSPRDRTRSRMPSSA